MRNKILTVLGAVALALGVVSVPAAHADVDTVITVTIKNHPEKGNGTPVNWADSTFVRTVIVHPADGVFSVTVKDSGTMITRKGAGSPNAGASISRKLTGTYTSTVSYAPVDGVLDGDKVGDLNGNVYDDKFGLPSPSLASWRTALFSTADAGGIVSQTYTFKTLDEQWISSAATAAGTTPAAGDITGKLSSKLTSATRCRISAADKRNVWAVNNVQGDRARDFWYWLKYANGTFTAATHSAVGTGGTTLVTTPAGGRLTVKYFDGYGVEKRIYAWSNYMTTHIVCS
jgi:hypothetical protein